MENYQIHEGILESYTGRDEYIIIPKGVHTIGTGALKGCVSLKKVVLPQGIRCIMDDAFKGCRKLEEVEIPEGVTYIGRYAFHRCHGLKRLILPTSVEALGDCAFLYCDSLREVRIPGVKRIGTQAFANGISLERLQVSEHLEKSCICDVFTGCGKVTEISFADGRCFSMPNVVEVIAGGIPVPSLVEAIVRDILRMMELEGRSLIRFRVNIKHIEVPEGIESLAKSCFYDMRGILTIKLPKSLKSIESKAFRNCIGLEKVIFGSHMVEIHKDAFRNCTALKTVRTFDGNEYTFEGISQIKMLSMERGNAEEERGGTYMRSEAVPEVVHMVHKQVLGNFRLSGTILLKYLGEETRVIVPEGVTRIAEEAFAGKESIDKVVLPDSLREIGAEAFRDCLLLQTIIMPDSVERIGQGAFENCVKLLRFSVPSRIYWLEARAFRHCRALQEVSLQEGLIVIEESAFYGCISLKKIQFPHSLTTIGEMAFYGCSGLKEARLQAGDVGSLAFAKSGVRKVCVCGKEGGIPQGKMYGDSIFADCTRLKNLVMEEGVGRIPNRFVRGCTALERVELPHSLKAVGINPFEGTGFQERWLKSCSAQEMGLSSWGAECRAVLENAREEIFLDGRNLEGEVWLPESVRIVAGGAFYGNKKITGIHLWEGVEFLGAAAFKGCTNLRRAWLPSGIKCLEDEVFAGCVMLEGVYLADTEILQMWDALGERSFYQCRNLRNLSLERVKRLGNEALAGCISLVRRTIASDFQAGERVFEDTCFDRKGMDGICIVGNILTSGSVCRGEVCVPEGVTGIAPYAFSGNSTVTKLVLPQSLLWIGEGAFFGCSGLKTVDFPRELYRIDAHAFEKCISLLEVESGVSKVGSSAFAGCTSLIRAMLPNAALLEKRLFAGCYGLEECRCDKASMVQSFCFSGCKNLKGFSFENLDVIRPYAFEGCEGIKSVEFRGETWLAEHALEDCCGLEKIIVSEGTAKIHIWEYAFLGCTFLRQVKYQGREWSVTCFDDIFSDCTPEIVRLLFHSALSCFAIEEGKNLCGYRGAARKIKIPEGICRIEAEVFRDCLLLEEVEFPKSLEYIGARAFHGTAWMERQRRVSSMVVVKNMLLDGSGCQGNVEISAQIRLVCGWAFANGLNIEKIRFWSERVQVGEYAFRNCIHLREMVLPDGSCITFTGIGDREKELPPLAKQAVMDSLNCFKTDEEGVLVECTGNIAGLTLAHGITAIGEGAFQDGNLLAEIRFPDTIKKIGKRAFAGCKWLSEVRGATGVEDIGELAFWGCGVLRFVELGDGLCRIGARAFENCTSLEEILIPEGVEEIPERAFYRCHSLKSIRLPSTLKVIGKEAFAFCRELSEIWMPEGVCMEERVFEGSKKHKCIIGNWGLRG